MADPEKLLMGVAAVYGLEYVERIYGEIPRSRNIASWRWKTRSRLLVGRKFRCLDTPGHARHHMCTVDEGYGGVFTGDTFGLSTAKRMWRGKSFLVSDDDPHVIDPDALERSIRRIVCPAPLAVYLTHYGRLADPGLQ